MLITELKAMYLEYRSKKMKSFIRAITIIFVLTLLPTDSITPISAQEITTEGVNVVAETPVSYSSDSDALMQLRTVLGARAQQHSGGKVLVIPTTQIQPQNMVTLMEDMTVMCRIFDKKLAQSSLISETPVWVRLSSRYSMGDRSMGAMYIQGYGALFMINVDFPLSPPPETEEKKEKDKEDTDQVWEQMKQEIFSPQEAVRRATDRQEEKYDAEKVENLKATLMKALVHAANIRDLKTDESVILTVTGSDVSSNVDKIVMNKNNQVLLHTKDRNIVQILGSPSLSDLGISSPTVLTIRVKKSYIDALAQNKIDFDEFEQKVQLISYPSLGLNISGRSSTSFWPAGTSGDWSPPSLPSVGVFEGRRSNRRGDRRSGIDAVEPSSSGRRTRR
jgi:hypothetical protein